MSSSFSEAVGIGVGRAVVGIIIGKAEVGGAFVGFFVVLKTSSHSVLSELSELDELELLDLAGFFVGCFGNLYLPLSLCLCLSLSFFFHLFPLKTNENCVFLLKKKEQKRK